MPQYTHLGHCNLPQQCGGPHNLQHRAALLRQLFKPLRSRLLYNRWLTRQEKVRLVSERALPRFLYGAGHWTPRNASAYRQSFRPITGISSAGYSNHEVAAVLGLPTAEELLHQARAVAFVDACETGSAAVHAALRKDAVLGSALRGSHFRLVMGEHVPISLCTTDPPNLSGLLETLPGGRAHARRPMQGLSQGASDQPGSPAGSRDTGPGRYGSPHNHGCDTPRVAAPVSDLWCYLLDSPPSRRASREKAQ